MGKIIPCSGCRHCQFACPKNIPVADYIKLLNDIEMGKDGESGFNSIVERRKVKPSACDHCGKCETACSQHLFIMYNLDRVKEMFES
jgi:predicted aldo/keto reductase-like oxidoreductase